MSRITTSLSLCLLLAGCGGSSDPGPTLDPGPQPKGLLSPVTDTAALETSIKDGLSQMTSREVLAHAASAEDASYTGTYTQELNVDEADSVRYDGEHLIVAPRRFSGCCFILEDALAPPEHLPAPGAIRILATDAGNGTAALVSEIELESGVSVQGMYQTGGRLVALLSDRYFGSHGRFWADTAVWAPRRLELVVYDLANPANPRLEFEAEIDGVFVETRRIGDTVYVVTRHTPRIDGLHYYVTTEEQQIENEQLLAAATLEDLLPKITIDDATELLAKPNDCYVTTTDDTDGFPVLTSVTAVPIDDPANFTTVCYSESAYGIYVSENAFYLTELRPDTMLQQNLTRIHKFAIAGARMDYRGSADIEGTVWSGSQPDFRLSEHNGHLRVLASQFDWSSDDFVDHTLYILRESATTPDLEIFSTLPNETRPLEIGKVNEALFGVRFLADKAYAVTFEQIDPLYVIDLSDPEDPFIAGELQVPGVSDFLHPVTEELLLGLGRDTTGGIKLELFDASDVTQPQSRGTHVIGGSGSYSEAVFDRHAFTYQPDVDGIDRFTVPANVFAEDGSYTFMGSALYLFEIHDKSMPALASLYHAGSVQPPAESEGWVERSRAFLDDDTIFYVRDEEVWASFWQTPSLVNGPF